MTQEPSIPTPLTKEQQQIVDHDRGPALVFAVAGAGKTTAMVHRIERLVRENVFAPHTILATSFSRASVQDIRRALARWPHSAQVQVSTLHAVGWGILKSAQRRGHLPEMGLCKEDEAGAQDSLVLARTLARAWRDKVDYVDELETLDRQDFQNYVGVCKANLLYADLARADLPPEARTVARQAPAPVGFEWYLNLYKLYEEVRRQENWLTFDDMLLTGWECLARFPDVLAEARGRWECVLVDEFQDVNLVQSEILDVLTYPHRNYMVIGDDDQTIYEWRGASPGFILDFRKRYGAAKYFISDNFRSQAAHLALANRVIERNLRREPKRLSLTQGFAGNVHVHSEASAEEQGLHIVSLIQQAKREGYAPNDMAILVRLYAQTPFIEQAFIEAGLPYRIIGSSPFYQRTEVLTLIDYLQLARWERDGQAPDLAISQMWGRIANRPNRYIPRAVSEALCRTAVQQGIPLSQTLTRTARDAPDRLAGSLLKLAETLVWLAEALDSLPADQGLARLVERLGYLTWLRRSSGFPETGESRAAGVQAFLRYAAGKGTGSRFLNLLHDLSVQQVGRNLPDARDSVSLMTVFRAKGLQWPVVFVPDCSQGTFPYGGPDELEEERRLFYVAITRPKTDLHLHLVKTERISQFLLEARWEETLAAVGEVKAVLEREPGAWRTQDALALARHTPALHLERYFQTWWNAAPEQTRQMAHRMQWLFTVARKKGLCERLALHDHHRAVWETFGLPEAEPDEGHFADLEQFASKAETESAGTDGRQTKTARKGAYQIGDQVRHPQHGLGAIIEIKGNFGSPHLKVQFQRGGPVVLLAKFVQREER